MAFGVPKATVFSLCFVLWMDRLVRARDGSYCGAEERRECDTRLSKVLVSISDFFFIHDMEMVNFISSGGWLVLVRAPFVRLDDPMITFLLAATHDLPLLPSNNTVVWQRIYHDDGSPAIPFAFVAVSGGRNNASFPRSFGVSPKCYGASSSASFSFLCRRDQHSSRNARHGEGQSRVFAVSVATTYHTSTCAHPGNHCLLARSRDRLPQVLASNYSHGRGKNAGINLVL